VWYRVLQVARGREWRDFLRSQGVKVIPKGARRRRRNRMEEENLEVSPPEEEEAGRDLLASPRTPPAEDVGEEGEQPEKEDERREGGPPPPPPAPTAPEGLTDRDQVMAGLHMLEELTMTLQVGLQGMEGLEYREKGLITDLLTRALGPIRQAQTVLTAFQVKETIPEEAFQDIVEDTGDLTCPRCDGPISLARLRSHGYCEKHER
jgi:hypothetical protein